jgi:maleylpyruvate isomerase
VTSWQPPTPDRPPVPAATPIPWTALDGCFHAHLRLHASVARVTDEVARRPSRLPGWSVGHLLTHLARNADSHSGMFDGAARGEVALQYPGGKEQRERDIAAGAGRDADVLRADVLAAVHNLERRWAELDEATWTTGVGRPATAPASVSHLVFLRWREVEIHLADLGIEDVMAAHEPLYGWRPDVVTDAYLDVEWSETVARLAARLPAETSVLLVPGDRPSRVVGTGDVPVVVRAEARTILAWLTGRARGQPGWPELTPWP